MIKYLPILLICATVLANDSYYYKGVIAVSSAVSGTSPGPNPGPKPPVPPAPVDDKCPDCDGLGYIGDGTIRVKCNACDGTGKRKKTEFDFLGLDSEVPTAFKRTLILPDLPSVQTPHSPEILVADNEGVDVATYSLRVILISEPSWCSYCRVAEDALIYLKEKGPDWKIGTKPDNHFQVLDSSVPEYKEEARKWRKAANTWLADNGRLDEQTTAVPIFITVSADKVIGVHIGWFEGVKPRTEEAMWKLSGLIGVTKENPKGIYPIAETDPKTEEPITTQTKEQAELEFVRDSKTPKINVRELIEKWGPGGKIVINDHATLKPSKDLEFRVEGKGDFTYLNVRKGTLSLDYTWGLFSGELDVPYIRVSNDLKIMYFGLKGPLPDFPIELTW